MEEVEMCRVGSGTGYGTVCCQVGSGSRHKKILLKSDPDKKLKGNSWGYTTLLERFFVVVSQSFIFKFASPLYFLFFLLYPSSELWSSQHEAALAPPDEEPAEKVGRGEERVAAVVLLRDPR
jgi:hypothetical protein